MDRAGPAWLWSDEPLLDPHGRGERAVRFVKQLRLHEGRFAGMRFPLQTWQERIIRRIYGDTAEDGRRRIRTVFLLLPRANGKTSLAAALGLLHLFGPEHDPSGQVIAAASDREQASIAFTAAQRMIQQDPVLARITRITESVKRISHPKSGSTFKAVSHEAYSKHGLSITCLIADEVHAWPTDELWRVLVTSMGKRDQPLAIAITTAGCGRHGIAWELYDYAKKVAAGDVQDETFLPILIEPPAEFDWQDETLWHAVNPALASGFRSLEELRMSARRAAEVPAQMASFKRLYLNAWDDGAREPWLDMAVYDEGAVPVELEERAGEPCWLGLDLASTEDMAALAACFQDEDGGFSVAPWFFVPEDTVRRRSERARVPYQLWRDEGQLIATPGNVIDFEAIHEKVYELAQRYWIREVVIDRWNSAATQARLQGEGLPVALFGQGFASMSGAVQQVERAILARKFRHGGHPILRWNFSNIVLAQDPAGNRKPDRAKSAEKIDGAVAAIMAIGRAAADAQPTSIYETTERSDGFLVL